jgi:molybdate transport system ATP-binding protein
VERGGFALDVDLAWDERVLVVFGPSGAGKSTLFEVVLGLHPRRRPRVRLADTALDDPDAGRFAAPERRGLGWVPQAGLLFPHLDVEGNLRFGAERGRHGGAPPLERVIEVLELGPLLGRRVDAISGGERQRVAIGRALASAPRALLLDEPLASLDLALRSRVLPYLLRVRDELELPLLYITHDPDEALIVGERVAVMDAGRIVAQGDPRSVLWSQAVLPLSEALGLENVLVAAVRESADTHAVVETRGGLRLTIATPAPLAPGEPLRLGVRAQDLLIAADPPGRISARNVIEARVRSLEATDDGCLVHLDAGEDLVAKITRPAAEALSLAPGTGVHLVVKSQAIRRLA